MIKDTLTEVYAEILLNQPESNLSQAFRGSVQSIGGSRSSSNYSSFLADSAKSRFEGVIFLDLGVDPNRAEEKLLLAAHKLIDWTYLANVYLGTLN